MLAAAASIATSAPEWSEEDSIDDLSARLDTTAPEFVQHFSVSSSEPHTVRVEGELSFSEEADPQAAVLVRIQADDGRAAETIVRASDSDGEDAELRLSLASDCEETCDQGYTLTLKLVDGRPHEHVDAEWSFIAAIGGEGTDEPEDAFVDVTQD